MRVVPIYETAHGGFEPLAGAMTGLYDGYGGADIDGVADAKPLLDELRALCGLSDPPEPDGRDVWHALSREIGSLRLEGRILSYILVDEDVARVMCDSVHRGALARVEARDVLGRPRSAEDASMTAALRAWKTRLRPIWERWGGQYRWEPWEQSEVRRFVDGARDRYGGNPAMLSAIAQNERAWRDG